MSVVWSYTRVYAPEKCMQAIVSQAECMQAQAAERVQAEEKQREVALQEAQNEQVGPHPVSSHAHCCEQSQARHPALNKNLIMVLVASLSPGPSKCC